MKRLCMTSRDGIKSARRVVVKVGTRLLVDGDRNLDRASIQQLVDDLVAVREQGRLVVLVSSGAIGAGLRPLGPARRPTSIPELQACAAVGQARLMQAYNDALARHSYAAAQILLTHADFQDRRRYLNFRNTLSALGMGKVLPVINENDTVSVEEIKFGDNDILAALVANAIDADLTILFSDTDGFYSADPRKDPNARRLEVVAQITPEIEAMADSAADLGTGGMASKIRAAKAVTAAGGAMILAGGKKDSLAKILSGEPVGTLFLPSGSRLDHRKRWIAYTLRDSGSVTVDAGGVDALVSRGKSLLPAGVKSCDGDFDVGDAVVIKGPEGKPFAKGLTNYSAVEVRRIMGRRTEEVEEVLGYKSFDEVVHRDNMVLL